ncbi:MAG: hypothetical protein ACRD0U_05475 [Acidimicrobiales bacterium]
MADIQRVQPIDGARVVTFNYTAASDALDALQRTATQTLGSQVEPRDAIRDELVVDWAGHFRDEFNEAYTFLHDRFVNSISWAPFGPTGEIYAAIGRANQQQTIYNNARQAEINAANNPAPATSLPPTRQPTGSQRPA